jgi:hypothetical protein
MSQKEYLIRRRWMSHQVPEEINPYLDVFDSERDGPDGITRHGGTRKDKDAESRVMSVHGRTGWNSSMHYPGDQRGDEEHNRPFIERRLIALGEIKAKRLAKGLDKPVSVE